MNARTEFDRSTQLLRNRVISRTEFDRAETGYTVAQQNYQAALQTFEQGTIAREEVILAKEAEVSGLEGQVVEANLQLRTLLCAHRTTALSPSGSLNRARTSARTSAW